VCNSALHALRSVAGWLWGVPRELGGLGRDFLHRSGVVTHYSLEMIGYFH